MKAIRRLLQGVSLTAAMFVFQACYGTPHTYTESNMTFRVVAEDGTVLPNVKISSQVVSDDSTFNTDWYLQGYTDDEGELSAYAIFEENMGHQFRFEDEEGAYELYDTVITEDNGNTVDIVLKKAKNGK